MKLRLLLLLFVCTASAVVSLLWMLCAILADSHRAWTIAVGFDQVSNAAFGGDEDETISSRCWRLRSNRKYLILTAIVNWLFQDQNHCKNAYEDELTRGIQ